MQPQDGYSCPSLNPRCRVHKYRRDIDKKKSISKRLNLATMVHVNKCIEMSTKLAVQIWTRKRTVKEKHCVGVEGIVYCCGEVGEAISRWHTTVVRVQTQHRDLQLYLYNNNTKISRCIYTATTHQSLFNYCTCEFSTDSGHVRMRSGSRTCPPPSLTATLLNGRLLWPMDRKMMRQTSHCYIH